jgi:hypothetical protein
MNFKEIPRSWLSCVFIVLAMIMTWLDLNGFVHTVFGLCVGYFFQKSVTLDQQKGRIR